jgi:hypothetical protein
MNKSDYLNEHKHLIGLLMTAHKPKFTKEATKQRLEVKNKISVHK